MKMSKDPQAVLDYKFDWAAGFLQPGEKITSFTVAVAPDDGTLAVTSQSSTDTVVTVFLGGGTDSRTYTVTNHVTTDQGRQEDAFLELVIRDEEPSGALSACEWPVVYPEDAEFPVAPSGMAVYEDMAAELLWRWTGRRFGLCEATIRPCRQDCTGWVSTYYGTSGSPPWPVGRPFYPALVRGQWFNIGCGGGCGDQCGCEANQSLAFEKPVWEVAEVQVDGVVLDPSAYQLFNSRYLTRTDGGTWPTCQDMSKRLGAAGTWGVTIRVGDPVPAGGQLAAGKLALELAKAFTGSKGCELPTRVQSVTRAGVSISMMLDTFDDLDKGKTGVWVVDAWVASVNKPDIGFSVASPDLRTTRVPRG
jgi:hypothetical protein